MTTLDIRRLGDPVLRTRASEVTDFDAELRGLVQDLTDSMLEAPGAGLAAPQIGVGLRVFTYHVDGVLGHVVNPVLSLEGDLEETEEGCLSIPGLQAMPPRAPRAVATGFDQHGEPVRIEGTALLAQCFQHETDHLDGVLFIDRLDPVARRRALKVIRSASWAGEVVVKENPHGRRA
ncbi:peptide deformylase [Mobilicoccus caccae]|uniref:Peptide deformylase n=1 Tax=Mobilicoccus caccae TaxID=1859295 RepID=A0ABQ6IR16_9MICO|nr:peptide deformylase [Mobilicoccus caccae]GMA39891.1 peptide deformylase [Mobilicoccus caccae]